jgi:hypothetical protein
MDDLVLITSVINTGEQPWSYSAIRSVYTPEERLEQTLGTIQTVKKYLPDAKILLIECSDISQDYMNTLQSSVDYFLDVYSNEEAKTACLQTNKKGWGEAVKTRLALEYILEQGLSFKRLFKLSGRYILTEKFKQENYSYTEYTFKEKFHLPNKKFAIKTVLFSVPYSLLENFYTVVKNACEAYRTGEPQNYEELVPPFCEPRKELPILGCKGGVAVDVRDVWSG